MNRVIRHSEYLLRSNDCVILPGLGAVLAHSESARLDEATGILMPPSRQFSFNSQLTHNDGLIASSVALSENIGYEAALQIVNEEIETMRHQLLADGELSLGHIGLLRADGDKTLFEPYDASALTPGLIWLPALRTVKLSERIKAEKESSANIGRRRRMSPVAKAARVAAAIAIAICLGFMISTPITTEDAQFASLAPETVKAPSHKAESLFARPGTATAPLVLILKRHEDAATTADTTAKITAAAPTLKETSAESVKAAIAKPLRFDENDRYCLVVASLATREEAERFITRNRKQQLGVLPKDGRYRVYAATGTTASGAQSAAAELADRYPDAWVCRR